jgi:hypothetical protein
MATTKLFNKDGTETPPRPRWNDNKQEIAEKAVDKLFAGKHCPFEEDEKEELIDSIVKHWYESVDLFELAKDFDDDGWHVDREFIDHLDSVDGELTGVIIEMIKEWGETNDIQQPLPFGTELDCGVIDGVYKYEPAKYKVKVRDDLGLLDPTSRRLIKWEDAVLKSDK